MLLQNDPFLNAFFNRVAPAPAGGFVAPMDAYRRGSDVWVHIDIPGIAADSLDISVERNVLTVTGERWADRRDGDHQYMNDRELAVGAPRRGWRRGLIALRLHPRRTRPTTEGPEPQPAHPSARVLRRVRHLFRCRVRVSRSSSFDCNYLLR